MRYDGVLICAAGKREFTFSFLRDPDNEGLNCDGFLLWNHGKTPAEHLQMNVDVRLAALEQHRQYVTWSLSVASLFVSVIALLFSVFRPAPAIIFQQPPASAAVPPRNESPSAVLPSQKNPLDVR
jgi:hypothetical protein